MSMPLRTIEKIHSLKSLLVKQSEWEFAVQAKRLSQAETVLADLEHELQNSLACIRQMAASGATPRQLVEWDEWVNAQRRLLQEQQEQCNRLAGQVEAARLRFIDRRREQEMWLRLKQKKLAYIRRHLQKQEQSELDEVSVQIRRMRLQGNG